MLLFRLLPILVFLALFALPASAGTVFRVGVEDIRYYPHYSTNNGVYTGFSRAVLDGFAATKGYEFIYVPLPILRLYDRFLTTDELDFKYPDNPQWQPRMRLGTTLHYSDPVSRVRDGVIVRTGERLVELDDLKSLGAVRGFTVTRYQDEVDEGKVRLTRSDDFGSLMKMVRAGRVEGGFGSLAVARYQMAHTLNDSASLAFASNLPYSVIGFCLSSRKYPQVLEELNEYLKENRGQIQLLRQRFGMDKSIFQ